MLTTLKEAPDAFHQIYKTSHVYFLFHFVIYYFIIVALLSYLQ